MVTPQRPERKGELIELVVAVITTPAQFEAWWERHGLRDRPDLSVDDVLAAIDADHDEALRGRVS